MDLGCACLLERFQREQGYDELEPELRTKRHPKIIVSAVSKIHGVSHFDAQAERSPEALETGSRVYREMGSATAYARNGITHGSRRYGTTFCEIDEPQLAGDEELEWTGGLKLRSK